MTIAFIFLAFAVIYFSIALATFEKFLENRLIPKSPVVAFILTPLIIAYFYIKLAIKAPSKEIAIECLKLGTLRFPLGIGLFIEGIHLRSEYELTPNIQTQKTAKHESIKREIIFNRPLIRIWKDNQLAHV